MKIHKTGDKAPRTYSINHSIEFGGVIIEPGWGIMPKPGVCGRHYVRTLAQIMKLITKYEICDKELENWIKNICPGSYLYGNTGEACLVSLANDEAELDLLNEKLDFPSDIHFSSTVPVTVGMESIQGEEGAAELVSFIGGLYFNHDYPEVRKRIRRALMTNGEDLHQLYLIQKSPVEHKFITNYKGEQKKVRHPFFDFIEELNIRILCFANYPRLLTRDYSSKQIVKGNTTDLHQSWMAEMSVINHNLTDLLGIAEKGFLDKIGISFKKLQQFLRGYAHLRLLDVDYGKHKGVSHTAVKTLGTLVFPMDASHHLKRLLDFYLWGELSTKQFESVAQIVRDNLVAWYSANTNGAIAQVLGRSPGEIDYEYFLRKNKMMPLKVKKTKAGV